MNKAMDLVANDDKQGLPVSKSYSACLGDYCLQVLLLQFWESVHFTGSNFYYNMTDLA